VAAWRHCLSQLPFTGLGTFRASCNAARVITWDDKVWNAAAERSSQAAEWTLLMRLTLTAGDPVDAAATVRDWAARRRAEDGETLERDPSRFSHSPGEWECTRASDHVVLLVDECDDYAEFFPDLGRELESHGFQGRISLWVEPAGVQLPRTAAFLGCRLTLRGTRERRAPRSYVWSPDPGALRELLGAADRWCQLDGGRAPRSLRIRSMPPLALSSDESAVDRLEEAFEANGAARVVGADRHGFRAASAAIRSGRLTFLAGPVASTRAWAPLMDELMALIREHADLLGYAFIWRGWDTRQALKGDELGPDWPNERPSRPGGLGFSARAFDDLVAPDAFGVQLIGPAYEPVSLPESRWKIEKLRDGRVLLKHVDPVAWFDTSFVPEPGAAQLSSAEVPPVLQQARLDLRAIIDSTRLDRLGFDDLRA
jgi:hypothetical protein